MSTPNSRPVVPIGPPWRSARQGPACITAPQPAHHAARPPPEPVLPPGATELRLGLDYLETRDDIDTNAIAYVGMSWGAGSRLIFAGTDDRFRVVVLVDAGIDERVQPTLPEASNINFAPYIRVPKLIVNGREDEEHPWRSRAQPLWNLLNEPRSWPSSMASATSRPTKRILAIHEFLDRNPGTGER